MKGTDFAAPGYRILNPLAMIENVNLSVNRDTRFRPECTRKCDEMNPQELLLYAAAKCTIYTLLPMLENLRIEPRRIEIGYSRLRRGNIRRGDVPDYGVRFVRDRQNHQ